MFSTPSSVHKSSSVKPRLHLLLVLRLMSRVKAKHTDNKTQTVPRTRCPISQDSHVHIFPLLPHTTMLINEIVTPHKLG